MAKNWIKKAISSPGSLHRQLGVKQGEKIPAKKMSAARSGKYGALAERRAHLAKTLGSFHDGGIVPQTGAYQLEKGETVVPAQGNLKKDDMSCPDDCCCAACDIGTNQDHADIKSESPSDLARRRGY